MEQAILADLRAGAVARALQAAKQWRDRVGLEADGVLRVLGAAAICAGDSETAAVCMRRAERLPGRETAALFDHWARACAMLGMYARAYQLARSALPAAASDPELACSFAEIALAMGRVDEACQALDQFDGPGLRPGRKSEIRARCDFKRGDAAGASRHALEALTENPDSVAALRVLGDTRSSEVDAPTLHHFENRLLTPADDRQAVQIAFALGSLFETRGEHARAFGHYRTANAAQARVAAAAPGAGLPALDVPARRLETLLAETAPIEPVPGPVPVFVLGMPRSGTTLVEQVLAQHPRVAALGERDEVMNFAFALLRGDLNSDPPRHALADFARRYLAAGGDAGWLVDKQPLNFAWLPLIRRAFPNARIIRMHRDPRDVLISIFASPMRPQITMATDPDSIVDHLELFKQLVIADEAVLDLDYEGLVHNFEHEVRRIADHCGLEWTPTLLDFAGDRRTVHTISAVQVRRPVNADSVGRWRRFESELAPWLPRLEALQGAVSS